MAVLLSQLTEKRNCGMRLSSDRQIKQTKRPGWQQFINYQRSEGNLIVVKVSRWPPLFFQTAIPIFKLVDCHSIWAKRGLSLIIIVVLSVVSILLLPKTALYVRIHVSNSSYSSPPPFIYPYLWLQGSYLLLYLLYNLFHFIRRRKKRSHRLM